MENETVKLNHLREIINNSRRIVFFGGAGVSTESGISDFRSASGLYNDEAESEFSKYSPEEMLHARFFKAHTELFFKYYFTNLVHPEAKPNAAHFALAKLEREGKLSAVVTQNIDGLHQTAGSERVCELHGSVHKNSCVGCAEKYTLAQVLETVPGVPRCKKCGAVVKPDVVLYGETLDDGVVREAVNRIRNADTLIIGGTSLSVYPAAGLLDYFSGGKLILINRGETAYDPSASLSFRANVGEILGAFV